MYSWARFEIFAWGGETPGVVVQEWTHDRMRKWTPPPINTLYGPFWGVLHILHWITQNQRPRTKIVLFTNLAWLITLVREQPGVSQSSGGEQGNPNTAYAMWSMLGLLRAYDLTIRTVMLEHHLYYDIPFASSAIQVVRIGPDSISSAPLIDEIMDNPGRKTYVEGKYIYRH